VQTLTKLPISRTVRDRQLEELQELGLVENNPTWKLTERAQELLAAAQLA
jgi:DNA-binding IclR family transcriptional regulator